MVVNVYNLRLRVVDHCFEKENRKTKIEYVKSLNRSLHDELTIIGRDMYISKVEDISKHCISA